MYENNVVMVNGNKCFISRNFSDVNNDQSNMNFASPVDQDTVFVL